MQPKKGRLWINKIEQMVPPLLIAVKQLLDHAKLTQRMLRALGDHRGKFYLVSQSRSVGNNSEITASAPFASFAFFCFVFYQRPSGISIGKPGYTPQGC